MKLLTQVLIIALRICFREVFSIALTVTLTFCLSSQINSIVTSRGVGLFQTLGDFLADFKALSQPRNNYILAFFFSIILSPVNNWRSNKVVFLLLGLIKDLSEVLLEILLPVNRFKKMSLKILNQIYLLTKANFLISSNWFFAQIFSQAFFYLFRSFFLALAIFFIKALVSGVALL